MKTVKKIASHLEVFAKMSKAFVENDENATDQEIISEINILKDHLDQIQKVIEEKPVVAV